MCAGQRAVCLGRVGSPNLRARASARLTTFQLTVPVRVTGQMRLGISEYMRPLIDRFRPNAVGPAERANAAVTASVISSARSLSRIGPAADHRRAVA